MRSLVEAKPAARGAATGPRFATPYGFPAVLRRNPLGFLVDCRRRYGDVVRILPGGAFVFAHPRDIRHVLQASPAAR
jgi:hypothetical protein